MIFNPFIRPVYVMAKPVGSACNLHCDYCYYRGAESPGKMNHETLEKFIKEYISLQPLERVYFIWQGGEPMLAGLDFYNRVVELQKFYSQGKEISNCLQTNGTLIDEEWAQWLAENEWLVGLSIDGSAMQHDVYRKDYNNYGSWSRVAKAIELLQRYDVEWNAMITVSAANVGAPGKVYDTITQLGALYLQFSPVVEWNGDGLQPYSVTSEAWGKFLCGIWERWLSVGINWVNVGFIDAALAAYKGIEAGVCTHCRECGTAAVITANGDVYPCDHYVRQGYKLGNINEKKLSSLLFDGRLKQFGEQKYKLLPQECQECKWVKMCRGECSKNRLPNGKNYLCQGYSMFYQKIFGDKGLNPEVSKFL